MPSINVTLTRSPIGYCEKQKRTVKAMGLRKLHQTVNLPLNDAVLGMVKAVQHLVVAVPAPEAPLEAPAKKTRAPKAAAEAPAE